MQMKEANAKVDIVKLHTTARGLERIARNLSISRETALSYCISIITDERADVVRRGKNLYFTGNDTVVTVNAGSHTIITAHRLKNEKQ